MAHCSVSLDVSHKGMVAAVLTGPYQLLELHWNLNVILAKEVKRTEVEGGGGRERKEGKGGVGGDRLERNTVPFL